MIDPFEEPPTDQEVREFLERMRKMSKLNSNNTK